MTLNTSNLLIVPETTLSSTSVKIGIDLVYVDDLRDFVEDPVDILLTKREWLNIANSGNLIQRLAGRFSAKEAIVKALGRGIDEIELIDIEIDNDSFGRPLVTLKNSAFRCWQQMHFSQLDISISHHKNYAISVAIAMK